MRFPTSYAQIEKSTQLPRPSLFRREVVVAEALQLMATEFTPDLVDAASASLHRFRGTVCPPGW